jgi:nucleolar protein 16
LYGCRSRTDNSYAALGLLPSIPLPNGASSSSSHRAALHLPAKQKAKVQEEEEVAPKVSYGRIIRDDEGNVVDIILDDDEEDQKMGEGEGEGGAEQEGREALNPEEDYVPEPVQAKTDVVRCKYLCSFPTSPNWTGLGRELMTSAGEPIKHE